MLAVTITSQGDGITSSGAAAARLQDLSCWKGAVPYAFAVPSTSSVNKS